jgi:DNA-binding CsgD family transcriptional regulator/tetratricopeptide (TPR) repeat protein
MPDAALLGRDDEIARLTQAVDSLGHSGGAAVLIRGDAGIGKSSLLTLAEREAAARGYRWLGAAGVESEANLPFAGLNQLLRPILARAELLPHSQREALLTAVGALDRATPAIYLVALAVLNLLSEYATEVPLLVTADDAHWLDGPTVGVLAFLGRRVDSDPILLVAAMRDGYESALITARLPEMRLEPLDEGSSERLLDGRSLALATMVRRRVLAAAAGNPLALVELPLALRSRRTGGSDMADLQLPLNERLQEAFAARATAFPEITQQALVVAALEETDDLATVIDATTRLRGSAVAVDALDPAVEERLVSVDGASLEFRHPLVRSGVEQSASSALRQAAHRALADGLAGDPDRRAWHRAASTLGTDDEVAADLEAAAMRAKERGAPMVALAGLERAAALTDEPARRATRLFSAAELGFELGQPAVVARLVTEAEAMGLQPRDQGRAMWLHEVFDDGVPGDPIAVARLVAAADRAIEADDHDLALNLINAAGLRCWWADPGDAARELVIDALHRLPVHPADPRVLEVLGLAAPVDSYGPVSAGAASAVGGTLDASLTRVIAFAAHAVGDNARSSELLGRAIPVLRTQGRLGLLAQALIVRAWDGIHLGRLAESERDADEGARLAAETEQPIWITGASIARALLVGIRGEAEVAETLTAEAESILLPARLSDLLSLNQLARGLTTLTAGRSDSAFDDLYRMFDLGDPCYNPLELYAAVGYLAEAAVHAGRAHEARRLMPTLEATGRRTQAESLHAGLRFARAVLAADRDAEPLFHSALEADPGWPFDGARLRLTFGAWLRRHGRIAESRPYLRTARDMFDRLGAGPWADRARQELRAAGEGSPERSASVARPLSPQELQIAQMAADGLSNREIGERLFLSHRTVGSHLYRIFPKLGIASRAELRRALEPEGVALV